MWSPVQHDKWRVSKGVRTSLGFQVTCLAGYWASVETCMIHIHRRMYYRRSKSLLRIHERVMCKGIKCPSDLQEGLRAQGLQICESGNELIRVEGLGLRV